MPGIVNNKWTSNPDKINHNTRGYTSKVIFNYQSIIGTIVPSYSDVFSTVLSLGHNYKGSVELLSEYFTKTSGRTFRVTMYFDKKLDGNDMNLVQYILNGTTNTRVNIATSTFNTPVNSAGGNTLAKYECNISYYFDAYNDVIQGIGNITYANSNDGTSLTMQPYSAITSLPGTTSDKYILQLSNYCNDDIIVYSVIVEEIS